MISKRKTAPSATPRRVPTDDVDFTAVASSPVDALVNSARKKNKERLGSRAHSMTSSMWNMALLGYTRF